MNRMTRDVAAMLLATVGLATGAGAALAQDATGYFTADQAQRGANLFNANCSQCHGKNLEGVEAPALSGVDVMGTWATAEGMYDYFSVAMPPTAPGKLGEASYVDIMAHILQVNGAPAGAKELTKADLPNVDLVKATAGGASASSSATPASSAPPSSAAPLPQAFTAGKQLPTVGVSEQPAAPASQPPAATSSQAPAAATSESSSAAASEPPAASSQPSLPQAFTFGKQLPTVSAPN